MAASDDEANMSLVRTNTTLQELAAAAEEPPPHYVVDEASKTKRTRDLILRSIAKLLDLDEGYFVYQISNKASGFARFNYYPPCPRPDLVLGRRPHTDGGLLTILFVDHDVGGLQVERGGKWYNVPPKPYTLVINVADCMEIMTNGIFRSPLHRVATNADKERLSLARFYAVDAETVLDDNRPPRYGKIKAKDFVSFSRLKSS
ncbi:1-aminocyclopropane-1-carboxylate oxidase-like [Triticum aestivum]|uniref:1-aminocyclopropane-1-carboxylate oxidase-like n=1 Tax=Triticum aestivum TaxID=4565 RepID=UPI001D010480|nr:1-aminocyclopropane-1-carboxylate oxidase-like [Triticum aestivum]